MVPTVNPWPTDELTGSRFAPDRALPYVWDALSAEVARQCIAEWEAWRDYGRGDRAGACERMAILTDLGRQQAAIELERRTGVASAPWSPKRNRRELTALLETATARNPEDLAPLTIRTLRTEVERPWTQYLARKRELA